MFKKSKSQTKIVPQGLANRISPETETTKEKDPPRPGSAISRDFAPKKQQKAIQNWKKNNSKDSTLTNESTNQQAVNTPFGYVPFKSAPLPIYGNRMNPNGTQPTTQTAIANYMQNAYQQSPHLQRPDSVLTATDLNSRPGSELGMFRLPSRYQSYTTLPRPEQLPIETQPIQQSVYGTMLPKVSVNHNRTASIERNSIYGTAEKRPLSQISGSKSLHTIHTEPYLPRVESKAALSFYGVPYPDEDPYGPKSSISWDSLNLLGALQILFGILILVVSGLRLFESPSNSHVYEIGFSILLVTNGLISCLSAFQHNYTLFVITLIFSTVNLLLSSFPIYSGAEPFLNVPEQKIITAFDAIKTQQSNPSNQLKFCLFVTSLVAALACLGNVLICCKSIGKLLFYIETLRFQNDLNKKSKEFCFQQ